MPILIVDENEVTRRLVAGVLAKRGYETIEASTGEEAIGMLGQGPRVMVIGEDVDRARISFPRVVVIQQPLMPDKLIASIENMMADKNKRAPETGEDFMRRAIDLSQEKMEQGCGGPFGAVIVRDGVIIGEGWNQVTSTNDPTAHAEMVAIRAAANEIGNFSLEGCEIYTSCEPCPMCLAAIYWARLDRVHYANTREDAEKIGFDDDHIYREFRVPDDKRTLPMKMMLHEEAQIVFDNWLKKSDRLEY